MDDFISSTVDQKILKLGFLEMVKKTGEFSGTMTMHFLISVHPVCVNEVFFS
jgi:hypothetical protein